MGTTSSKSSKSDASTDKSSHQTSSVDKAASHQRKSSDSVESSGNNYYTTPEKKVPLPIPEGGGGGGGLTKVSSSYKLNMNLSSSSQRNKRYPDEIILIRHGESLGNVQESAYEVIPDWKVPLTERGINQAKKAGKKVHNIINNRPVSIYYSPYMRTKQTLSAILGELTCNDVLFLREEPRMTEQQFGNFQKKSKMDAMKDEKKKFGKFYYRIPNGESGMDVYNRVSSYIGTLFREFERHDNTDQEVPGGPILIITHGLTLRLFLMRWFQVSVTEFEDTYNPDNGDVVVMTRVGSANSIYRNHENLNENLYYLDEESQQKQRWPKRLYDLTQVISRKISQSLSCDQDLPSINILHDINIEFERKNSERIEALKRESEEGFFSVYKGMESSDFSSAYSQYMSNESLNAMMQNRQNE